MRRSVAVFLIWIGAAGLLTGCRGAAEPPAGQISALSFTYMNYLGDNNNNTYTVEWKENTVWCSLSVQKRPQYGIMTMEADAELLEALNALYLRYSVADWDGFDETNVNVLDGEGFDLQITLVDGSTVCASGSNAFPPDFADFEQELFRLLRPYARQLFESARLSAIENGDFGTALKGAELCFQRNTPSGTESFDVYLYEESERVLQNYFVRINSVEGEFLEPGEYTYRGTVPVDAIDFAGIQALIEQYDVRQWYDYYGDGGAGDDEEYFNVTFHYADGWDISAWGGPPPENYDAFRHDLLALICRMSQELAEPYNLR